MTQDFTDRIINLMQFARKAGKVVAGTEACLRALHSGRLHLVVTAADLAERTYQRISNATRVSDSVVPLLILGTIESLSSALGLPLTGVYGVTDRQFAAKMREYHNASQVEE